MGTFDYQHSQPLGTKKVRKMKYKTGKKVKCSECAGPHVASECDSEIPDQGFTKIQDAVDKGEKFVDVGYTQDLHIISSGTKEFLDKEALADFKNSFYIKKETKPDMINHPKHYTKGIEVLQYTESWDMGVNDYAAIKYITRYRTKHEGNLEKQIEDLKKAEFYVKRQIARLQDLSNLEKM